MPPDSRRYPRTPSLTYISAPGSPPGSPSFPTARPSIRPTPRHASHLPACRRLASLAAEATVRWLRQTALRCGMPRAAAVHRRAQVGRATRRSAGSTPLSAYVPLLACLAGLVPVALFCAACASTDPLLKAVEDRIGSAALACGVVLPGDDSSAVDSCAVSAFRRGVSFWVRYGSCAPDGAFESFYLVSTGEGLLHVIRYETGPTRATSRFGAPRFIADRPCEPEIFQVTPGHFRLGCRGSNAPQPFVPPTLTFLLPRPPVLSARR